MSLQLTTLNKWRQDALYQNNWRFDASTQLDYVDGNQFPGDLAAKMQSKGLPLIPINICKATVDTACGILERTQTDAVVLPDDDDSQDVADVLSYRVKVAGRETMADRKCLDAGKFMFGGGIGWVEVSRVSDVFQFPYRVGIVPFTEMWTDPRSRESDYSDGEYLRRLRFFERGAIQKSFPQQAGALMSIGRGSDMSYAWYEPQEYLRNNFARDITNVSFDLWGGNRDLVALEEIQYREITMAHVFRMPGEDKWQLFDENNPIHMTAHNVGIISVQVRPMQKTRQAIYCGDYPFVDTCNPAGGNRFTLIPFVFEREARTGVPYGPIRHIIPLQDEVNTRRAKAVYALLSTKTIVHPDAVDDMNLLREEIGRRDSMIILGKKWKPGGMTPLDITDGLQMSDKQLELSEKTMQMAPQISGVPLSLQGVRDGSVDSGVGIDKLADYGINSLSRPFAHFHEARRKVYDVLLHYIIEDIGKSLMTLSGTDQNERPVKIQVNVPCRDEEGREYIDNDLSAMDLKVVLDDVPHSATHRQEQLKVFMQAVSATPPDIQQLCIPFIADLLDIPPQIKKQLVQVLKQKMGIGPEDMTPEQQQAVQQGQQAAQAQAQNQMQDASAKAEQQHQLDIALKTALIRKANAEADKASSGAIKDHSQAHKADVDALATLHGG